MHIGIVINNKAYQIGTTPYPDDSMWDKGWQVRIGKKFRLFGKNIYFLIYTKITKGRV